MPSGEAAEPVLKNRSRARSALLEQEDRAVDHDDGLAPGCDAAEPAGTSRFTTIILAVINSHDGSAPAGGRPDCSTAPRILSVVPHFIMGPATQTCQRVA